MASANPTDTRTYPAEPHTAGSTTTRTEKGISLARGPALILGTILTAVGLYLLYKARTFPPFSNFPNGAATRDGDFLFGLFGANGWTGMLTAVGGSLLLFGAAQHLLAKTMSLIVGIALGAAAVIALISGNVLGMAAANGWTKLGWAVAAVILLFNTLIPRRRREVVVADEGVRDAPVAYERRPVVANEATAVRRDEAEPAVVHRDGEETAVGRGNEPTVVDRGSEPTAVDAGNEPTAVDRGSEPTAVDSGNEPTAVDRGNEPTAVDRGNEPTAVEAGNEPTAVEAGNEPTAVEAGNEPTAVDAGNEPTAVDRGGEAEPTVVNRGDQPAAIRRD
jgi:hypothetical protein